MVRIAAIALAWKARIPRKGYRGFESLTIRMEIEPCCICKVPTLPDNGKKIGPRKTLACNTCLAKAKADGESWRKNGGCSLNRKGC